MIFTLFLNDQSELLVCPVIMKIYIGALDFLCSNHVCALAQCHCFHELFLGSELAL